MSPDRVVVSGDYLMQILRSYSSSTSLEVVVCKSCETTGLECDGDDDDDRATQGVSRDRIDRGADVRLVD